MLIIVDNKLTIKDASEKLKKFCEKELVMTNPEYIRRVRMNKYTGKTPEYLYLYEKDGDDYILPYGCLERVTNLGKFDFEYKLPPTRKIDVLDKVPLYGYQNDAVRVMQSHQVGILVSPAGSGKTQMAIALACRLKLKTLWITHTLDLVQQSYERACQYIDKSLLGKIVGGKVEIGSFMTFATVQTLSKLDLSLYKDCFDCIIVDECHRVSGSATNITMFKKALDNLRCSHVYGITATMHRADGTLQATNALLGGVQYTVSKEEVQSIIINPQIKVVRTNYKLDFDSLNVDGTLNYCKMVNCLTGDYKRNETIISVVKDCEGPCLFLSERVNQIDILYEMLPERLKKLACKITGITDKDARKEFIDEMKYGKKKILFSTYLLAKEGLDIPCLENLIMCSPVRDEAIVTQALGRISRISPTTNKLSATCYDFLDDNRYYEKSFKERKRIYKLLNCTIEEL